MRRSRVPNPEDVHADVHDRVNYSATRAQVDVDPDSRELVLSICVDTSVSSPMEYLEIFMKRMQMCSKAAKHLGLAFHLDINGQRLV